VTEYGPDPCAALAHQLIRGKVIEEGNSGGLRNRLALRYAVNGDLRFISHQDTLRLFKRAFARAGLPLRYSEGFNPHPRLSVVLPRPVGVASEDELLIVELEQPVPTDDARGRLAEQLPAGLRIIDVAALHDRDRRVPVSATYRVPIRAAEGVREVTAAIGAILASRTWPVERDSMKGPRRQLDLRAFVTDLDVVDADTAVRWRQSISQDGTMRVGEVLEALRLLPREHLHLVVRENVEYAE